MRILLPAICGLLIGAGLSTAYHTRRQDGPVRPEVAASEDTSEPLPNSQGAQVPPDLHAVPSSPPGDAGKNTAPPPLAATGETGVLPAPETLLSLLEGQSGTDLARQIGHLLRAGPEGFPVLVQFLRKALESPGISAFQEGRLSFSLLAMAAHDQERVAQFAEYLLPLLSQEEDPEFRQQVLRFLPPFLAASGDRFPGLVASFRRLLLADLERAGEQIDLWRLLEAMDTLGVETPVETLQAILADPRREKQHTLVIRQLGKRNELAALGLLAGHVEGFGDFNHWSVRESLQAISLMTLPEAKDLFEHYLNSPSEQVRVASTLAWFSSTRDLDSLPLAIRFLNSDCELAQKQSLLEKLRQRNRAIVEALQNEPGLVSDPRLHHFFAR